MIACAIHYIHAMLLKSGINKVQANVPKTLNVEEIDTAMLAVNAQDTVAALQSDNANLMSNLSLFNH